MEAHENVNDDQTGCLVRAKKYLRNRVIKGDICFDGRKGISDDPVITMYGDTVTEFADVKVAFDARTNDNVEGSRSADRRRIVCHIERWQAVRVARWLQNERLDRLNGKLKYINGIIEWAEEYHEDYQNP